VKRPASRKRSRQVRIWLTDANTPELWELDWWEDDRQVGLLAGACDPALSEGALLLSLASLPPGVRRAELRDAPWYSERRVSGMTHRHKYWLSGWGYEQFQLELLAHE
jgi:hypothetical protein